MVQGGGHPFDDLVAEAVFPLVSLGVDLLQRKAEDSGQVELGQPVAADNP
jgi:hypothetical protein